MTIPRATLTVLLSVDSYDPSQPQGTLTCSLKNNSREAIFVPAEYDGRQMVIYGHGKTHRSESRLWKPNRPGIDPKPEEAIARTLRIDPGETKVVFEVSLKELLTPATGATRESELCGSDERRLQNLSTNGLKSKNADGNRRESIFLGAM